jgi:WhiB family redox-sensing transcriptional regulator
VTPHDPVELTANPPRPRTRGQTPVNWRDVAACLDADPELFFPTGNTYPALVQIEKAKVVCRRCEVAETCLRWAMESGQDSGVWGGLSEDERRSLKRRTARAGRTA